MTNYEFYAKDITENAYHFALVDGKIQNCDLTQCSNCEFQSRFEEQYKPICLMSKKK